MMRFRLSPSRIIFASRKVQSGSVIYKLSDTFFAQASQIQFLFSPSVITCDRRQDMWKNNLVHYNKHRRRIAHHFWFKRRLDLSVRQPIPVDAPEEDLLPDIHLALWTTAETLGRMLCHQLVTHTGRRLVSNRCYFNIT